MSTNKELFKEAIADAKAVREAALANAKAALEEALTPRIQSMLSAKLQEMEGDVEEESMGGYMEEEEDMEEGFATDQFGFNKLNDVSENYGSDEEDFDLSEILAELEDEEGLNEAKKEKDEEESEEESVSDMSVEDLKDLIKSIVTQEIEAEEEETPADEAGEEEYMDQDMPDEEAGSEDEIDLEELLAELDAMDDEDGLEEAKRKKKNSFADFKQKGAHKDNGKLGKKGAVGKADNRIGFKKVNTPGNDELMEAVSVIKTLRRELNEQNLLNAKLLYVNKIFKAKNLTESQKVKVIASFDRATTPKEAKIVFESLSSTLKATPAKASIRESLGFASKAAGTAPKKTIVESDAVITRMQKLANIIK
jgi:hypothetical protein